MPRGTLQHDTGRAVVPVLSDISTALGYALSDMYASPPSLETWMALDQQILDTLDRLRQTPQIVWPRTQRTCESL